MHQVTSLLLGLLATFVLLGVSVKASASVPGVAQHASGQLTALTKANAGLATDDAVYFPETTSHAIH